MNEDFLDLLRSLLTANARFLIVGAHALAVHGVPRATGDLDVWVEPSKENASRVWAALTAFGAPVTSLDITDATLAEQDVVIQIGVPPRRIDLLTSVSGLDFATAWDTRLVSTVAQLSLPFISRDALIANKRATGRLKDLADLEALGESPE
ncbi:MAG: hypothetical protein AMS20_07730 [Gemmatimonas sp. SG8_28]|jgi:hypothetical protein|nr:MAG: hypothetical protein AMS20_07730 [Gemmatimonas sp. SG8_28]